MLQNAGKCGLDQWNFTLLPTSSSQVRCVCECSAPRLKKYCHHTTLQQGLCIAEFLVLCGLHLILQCMHAR